MTSHSPSRTDSLRSLLEQLTTAGLQPVVTGQPALALAAPVQIAHEAEIIIYVSGPLDGSRADQRAVGDVAAPASADLTEWREACAAAGARLQTCADPTATAAQRAAETQVRAWTLLGRADGVEETTPGVLAEIEAGRLRLRDEPRRVLRGDAEKLLELAVWAATTGLKPTSDLLRQARRDSGHVLGLDRAIWCDRFGALLTAWRASVGLQFLQDARILPLMVPEVSAMVDFHKSCRVHHKDIWDHTLKVVDKCPPSLTVRWTALMHDTGKVWTRSVTNRGKVHFFRHEELGGSLMEGVAGRFHMDAALRDRVVYVISNHARANVYATDWTDSAVRRLIRDMGEHLDDVIAFSSSDYTTKRAWRIKEVRALAGELVRRIEQVREADARVPPLPKGFGNTVMQVTGRRGGPWLGVVQRWLEAQVEAGELEAGLPAEAYLAHVQAHAPELLDAADPPRAPRSVVRAAS